MKIASHTSQLEQASAPFEQALRASTRAAIAGGRTLLAGSDGARIFSATRAISRLAHQIARPIDWSATLEALAESGVSRVLDLGPGHALAEMMHALHPTIPCYAVDGFRTIGGLRRWIASE